MKRSYLIVLGIAACIVLAGSVKLAYRTQQATAAALRPGTVPAAEAQHHIGQTITVEGVVSGVHVTRSAAFIDIGRAYPDEDFTGVVFADDESRFPGLSGLEGKTVDITGPVKLYRGRPEIVLAAPKQLAVH